MATALVPPQLYSVGVYCSGVDIIHYPRPASAVSSAGSCGSAGVWSFISSASSAWSWRLGVAENQEVQTTLENKRERQYKYICNSYQGAFIAHSFEYTAPSDMVCDTVPKSTQTLHVHRKNKACRILQITGEPNPYLDPCNGPVLQWMKIHIAQIDSKKQTSNLMLQFIFPRKHNIPSYTNYVNHTASLVTDKTPPFLPAVLVDLLASGPDFRPPLHPQPEVGGTFLGLGSQ